MIVRRIGTTRETPHTPKTRAGRELDEALRHAASLGRGELIDSIREVLIWLLAYAHLEPIGNGFGAAVNAAIEAIEGTCPTVQ